MRIITEYCMEWEIGEFFFSIYKLCETVSIDYNINRYMTEIYNTCISQRKDVVFFTYSLAYDITKGPCMHPFLNVTLR